MKRTFQSVAVNKAGAQRVRAELNRIRKDVPWLAGQLGLRSGTVSNVISGCNRGESTKQKIELVLNLPAWSSAEEFIARLDTPQKVQAYKRAIFERAGGQIAAQENFGKELQEITAKLGLTIVICQFDGSHDSPFWNSGDTGEPFRLELSQARAGEFDSAKMIDGSYFCFYHVSDLAKALSVLKCGIESRGLLDHARIFYIEAESSGWRMVWPATGELILPSPWNT